MKQFFVGMIFLATLGTPVLAWACSCAFTETNAIRTQDGVVPVNLGGVIWERTIARGVPRIERENKDGTWTEVAVTTADFSSSATFVKIDDFRAGRYRAYTSGIMFAEFRVAGTFKPPSDKENIVRLTASPVTRDKQKIAVAVSCRESIDTAFADIEVTLPPELEKYRDLLWYEPLVPTSGAIGDHYHFRHSFCSHALPGKLSWQSASKGQIIAQCVADDKPLNRDGSVRQGIHNVRVRVSLPGTGLSWTSNTVKLDLRCNPSG